MATCAGRDGILKLGDFGLAEVADDLAEEQADRSNLVGKGKPSGGFHKRHLVRALRCPCSFTLFLFLKESCPVQ